MWDQFLIQKSDSRDECVLNAAVVRNLSAAASLGAVQEISADK